MCLCVCVCVCINVLLHKYWKRECFGAMAFNYSTLLQFQPCWCGQSDLGAPTLMHDTGSSSQPDSPHQHPDAQLNQLLEPSCGVLSRDFSQINQPAWVIRSPTSERHYLSKTFNFQSVCQGRLEIWNLIYFEQVCGGDDNINHLIFISTWQSLFRTGPERHGWAGRKCEVKSDKQKKGGGDVKWHLEGRRNRAGRDHLSQEAAEPVGEKNVLLSDSRWWSSSFFFFFLPCPCFALKLTYAKKMIK